MRRSFFEFEELTKTKFQARKHQNAKVQIHFEHLHAIYAFSTTENGLRQLPAYM